MRTFIPTPSSSTLELGFFTVHYYALCILLGIFVAIWTTRKRYERLGGDSNEISDLAIYLIPLGIIGGRIYHVITSPQKYFGSGGSPLAALAIWQGGLGIWGAISAGAAVAYFYYRKGRRSLSFAQFADALAPGLLLAQGIGRFGNWFNGELFGKPTQGIWGLQIPVANRPIGFEEFSTFQPTFLFEALWCFLIALIIYRAKFFKRIIGSGSIFLFYVASYSFGRLFIESIRIDTANLIFGLRLNIWVAGILAIGAGAFFIHHLRGRKVGPRGANGVLE
jgi:prolipoprotein diacylglyceryl transferase